MHQLMAEGKAIIKTTQEDKISKEMPVFYNPVMKSNRDISVLLLNSINKNNLSIADPLAGSGIRSIRFLLELNKNKIKTISINDYSKSSIKSIKENLRLNKIKISKKIIIKNEDANLFLLKSTGFDYIDVDPFGTPNPYLDSAIKRLARDGILAVTATDTAPLCGTYPTACLRKYWAMPLRNELMHEIGLRILIRKIQLIGAQYEKALMPIFSYYKEHYFRVFLRCEKGKKGVDDIIKQHGMFENAGPLWKGKLWDSKLTDSMTKKAEDRFLSIINEESKIDAIGFYDIHKICKRNKIKQLPKKGLLIEEIRKAGYKAAETHFNPWGVRSDITLNCLLSIISQKRNIYKQ